MNTSIHRAIATTHEACETLEAEVIQLWGDNPIAHQHATEGSLVFPVGDGEVEIARWASGELLVTPPGAAAFPLRAGHSVDVGVGEHTFRVSVAVKEARPKRAVAAAILEDTTLRTVLGSGAVHAALLAAFAFLLPAMSQADELTVDRDRMLNLKAYLDSAAEREQPQKDTTGDGAPSGGATSAERARAEEGKLGGPTSSATHARFAVRGDAQPEDTRLARDRALSDAAHFGFIGLLSAAADPNAPAVPWGSVAAGAERESHLGDVMWGDPGDVFGTGLGLSGAGEGAGGKGEGIGLGGVGALGRCFEGTCTGGHGGVGHGHGGPGGGHTPHGPGIRWVGDVKSNGRIDPAVIQRVVRLNSGRFVGCYKQGLQTNPSLEGRVAVSFLIGRDGSVASAKDTSGSDLADSGVRACVVRSFYSLSFPAPDGLVSVTYPFTFTPE